MSTGKLLDFKISIPKKHIDAAWALLIGSGLALLPVHNSWITKIATNSKGETLFFIPAFGYLLLIMGSGMFIANNWERVKAVGLGSRYVYIPLLVIVISMGISGFINGSGAGGRAAPLLMGLCMAALYVTARCLIAAGNEESALKAPILAFVAIGIVSGVVAGIVVPGSRDGGMLTNYCAAVGYLVLGGLLLPRKWLWIAAGPVLVAIFFLGALEGVFIIAVLLFAALLRKDWSRKALLPLACLVIMVVVWTAIGNTRVTYQNAAKNVAGVEALATGDITQYGSLDSTLNASLTGRWTYIVKTVHEVKAFGHGYVLNPVPQVGDRYPVHNAPLMVMDQVGPIAAIAWLWLALYCIVRTKWKYLWIAVLAASVFDYYIWTQFAPWFFLFLALSTAGMQHRDLIFKKTEVQS